MEYKEEDKKFTSACYNCQCQWFRDDGVSGHYCCLPYLSKDEWDYLYGLIPEEQNKLSDCKYWRQIQIPNLLTRILNLFKKQ